MCIFDFCGRVAGRVAVFSLISLNLVLASCGGADALISGVSPPTITPSVRGPQRLTVEEAITTITFTKTGGAIIGCESDRALPTGLLIDPLTCAISGIPTTPSAPRNYAITVTGFVGKGNTVQLNLEVVASAPLVPVLPAEAITADAVDGVAIAALTVSNTGGNPDTCQFVGPADDIGATLVDTLSGLTIAVAGNNCSITGTLTSVGMQTFTVRATNVTGSDDATVQFTVNPKAPVLPAEAITADAVDGVAIAALTVSNTGGNPATCQFVGPADDIGATLVDTLSGLTIAVATDNNDCTITGTLTGVGDQTFTVRATNATDSDDASVVFTVNPAAPVLPAEAITATAVDGVAIAALTVSNTGGQPATCQFVDPADNTGATLATMLNGLTIAVAGNNCTITGTLTGVGMQTFTVRATNGEGSDDASVVFTVNPAAPVLPAEAITATAVDGVAIAALTVSNTGGQPATCQFVNPADATVTMLSGLTIAVAGNNCSITGTLTGVGEQTFAVRATNVTGSADVDVVFTVNHAAPVLPAEAITATAVDGVAIAALTVSNTGGQPATCQFVNPADATVTMLSGLTIAVAGNNCTITGTLTGVGMQTFAVRATNGEGSADASVVFTVNHAAPVLPAEAITATAVDGVAIAALTVSNTGGQPATCQFVNPADATVTMLSGLTIAVAGNNCTITGTLTGVGMQTFAVRATNGEGSADASVVFTVNHAAPVLPAEAITATAVDGVAIAALTVSNTGGQPATCQFVNPADATVTMLSGLTIAVAGNNCTITGTLTGVGMQTFAVRATNGEGSADASVVFTVNHAAPVLPAEAITATAVDGVAIAALTVSNTGGQPATCQFVNPADATVTMLSGLTIAVAGNNCTITGTLTGVGMQTFAVRATNGEGSADASVVFTVNHAAPVLPAEAITATAVDGVAIAALTVSNTGGQPATCQFVNPADATVTMLSGLTIAVAGNNCTITGTLTGVGMQTFAVRATNGEGSADASVVFTVNPAAPSLQPLGGQSYPTGAPVDVALVNGGGRVLTGCTIARSDSSAVPDWLSVVGNADNSTCVITGTPPTAMIAVDYMITATNITDSSTITVSIAVVDGVATFDDPGSLVYLVTATVNESFFNTNTSGGRVNDCTSTGTLPAGLSVDEIAMPGDGCTLTGTANTITAQDSYTITATNGNGEASLTLDITVNPKAPVLPAEAIIVADPAVDGMAIAALTVSNTGGNPATCQFVDPADNTGATLMDTLSGLTIAVATDNNDCTITGTLTGVGMQTFAVRATNVTGSADASVVFTVNPAAPDLADVAATTYYVTEAGRIITFPNTGGAPRDDTNNGCTVSPDSLPAGLEQMRSTDGTTCVITGTPTALAPTDTFTVTATNTTGSGMAMVGITVRAQHKPILRADSALVGHQIDEDSEIDIANDSTETGGMISSCELVDSSDMTIADLNGLTISTNANGCQITGMPTVVGDNALRVRATSVEGGVSDILALTVNVLPLAPVLTVTGSDDYRFELDETITAITFGNAGGPITMCVPAPALPRGLSINDSNCTISGVPDMLAAMNTYTITATGPGGSDEDDISIEVYIDAPILADIEGLQALEAGEEADPAIVFTNTGGSIASCSVDTSDDKPDLPAGLMVESFAPAEGQARSCRIFGTPNDDIIDLTDTYTITATNGEGSDTATVEILITTPPDLADLADTVLIVRSGQNLPLRFVNNGGAATVCGVSSDGNSSPPRPLSNINLELEVVDGTCVIKTIRPISPSAAQESTTYTISSSNILGSGPNATVTLEVLSLAQVSIGDDHTCAINPSQQLWCWGDNAEGQLGRGNTTPSNIPVQIGTESDWIQVSSGLAHTCAIKAGGELYCWGQQLRGRLGNGQASTGNVLAPTRVGSKTDWTQVSVGRQHTCALDSSGLAYCWGLSNDGQTGHTSPPTSFDVVTPQVISAPAGGTSITDWLRVATKRGHACAIRDSGELYCWGAGANSQIGNGDNTDNQRSAVRVGTDSDWLQVGTGSSHSCAIKRDGDMYCWGTNLEGRLGTGDKVVRKTPALVDDDSQGWRQVSMGQLYTCAVKREGELYCWGAGGSGVLGLGQEDLLSKSSPTRVGTDSDWIQVSVSPTSSACAVKKNGNVYCWGRNINGILGTGTDVASVFVPTQVMDTNLRGSAEPSP